MGFTGKETVDQDKWHSSFAKYLKLIGTVRVFILKRSVLSQKPLENWTALVPRLLESFKGDICQEHRTLNEAFSHLKNILECLNLSIQNKDIYSSKSSGYLGTNCWRLFTFPWFGIWIIKSWTKINKYILTTSNLFLKILFHTFSFILF